MKSNLFILFIAVIMVCSCSTSPSKVSTEDSKSDNDSIQIVLKPYKDSDLIEYEIPIITGTGIKHGEQKRLYRNGSLYSSIPYVNGKREGIAFTYYQATEGVKPNVWKEQVYKNHLLNGVCKRYHDDGTLQAEYEYKNGLPAIGLKEFSKSGKPIKQPGLIVSQIPVRNGYYISVKLSKEMKNVDYFMSNLVEGKYLPRNLKGLQINNGLGEIVVSDTSKSVTITAVYSTRYRNKGLVSKTIRLP